MSNLRVFRQMLRDCWAEKKYVCVGLDSDLERVPEEVKQQTGYNEMATLTAFNRSIIEATHKVAGTYKINSAFYEEHGYLGIHALHRTVELIRELAPGTPVILDAKRADIGNSNRGYARFAFEYLKVDAITVHPYLGKEAMQPFLDYEEKGIIVLCRTSNPGAGEFQDLVVDGEPMYVHVARNVVSNWNGNGNCCLVVGATYIDELALIRSIVGDMDLLIPGVGVQGGVLEDVLNAGHNGAASGMIINSSRGIIFAASDVGYTEAAYSAALHLNNEIYAFVQRYIEGGLSALTQNASKEI